MRDQIKKLATRLFTLSGYSGMTFGDLTEELGTTRANIHYHFVNKVGLAEEILDDAAARVTGRYEHILTNKDTTLVKKLQQCLAFNRERYMEYNPADEGRIWSVITRLRLDRDVLPPKMVQRLDEVTRKNQQSVDKGVRIAMTNGELLPEAPVKLICVQIGGVLQYAPMITQYPYNFSRLKQTYDGLAEMITAAYGIERAEVPGKKSAA